MTTHLDQSNAYLESLKTTLWADWIITDPARRHEAALWLAKQVEGVLRQTPAPGATHGGTASQGVQL